MFTNDGFYSTFREIVKAGPRAGDSVPIIEALVRDVVIPGHLDWPLVR